MRAISLPSSSSRSVSMSSGVGGARGSSGAAAPPWPRSSAGRRRCRRAASRSAARISADLEQHRARIERIEHQEVDGALRAGAHRVAAAVGHHAVADLEQHFERAVGRILARQPADDAGDLDAALEAAADLEEAPAGEAVHVLVDETGEARELAQQHGHRARRVVAGLDPRGEVAARSCADRRAPASRRARSGRGSGSRCRRRCRWQLSRPVRAAPPRHRRRCCSR